MTSQKRYVCLIFTAAFLLAVISLFFVFAPAAAAEEIRYTGTPIPVTRSDKDLTINYTSYNIVEQGELTEGLPYYTVDYTDLPNACAPLAGTVIAGYYDITLPDLIPGFTSKIFGSYRKPTTALYNVIDEMYSLMHVNETCAGASENEFDSGLAEYVSGKGYHIAYTAAASNGKLDYAAIKSAIDSQSPVLVFAPTVDFYDKTTYAANKATCLWKSTISNHIFIIGGYKKIVFNIGEQNEFEHLVYYVSDLHNGFRTMILGDISVHNAKGVKIY